MSGTGINRRDIGRQVSTRRTWKQRAASVLFGMVLGLTVSSFLIAPVIPARATDATLMPNAKQQYLDDAGNPVASGSVGYYVPSTSTKKIIWQDAGKATAQTNPVPLDAAGRPEPAGQTFGDGVYRQVVRDANNIVIWDALTTSTGSGGSTTPSTVGDGLTVGSILPWAGLVAPTNYLFAYGQAISRTTYPLLFSNVSLPAGVICTSGINVLSGIASSVTDSIPIGAAVEATCVPPGTTVVGVSTNSVVISANASASAGVTATFLPFGGGNGSTTFNLPDLRGQVLAGRNNMGGTPSSRLASTYFGTRPNALGAAGGNQSHLLTISELPASPPAHGDTTISLSTTTAMQGNVDGGTSNPTTYRFGNNTTDPTVHNLDVSGTVTVTGSLGGGFAHPIVQPTLTMNYVIKVSPDVSTTVATGVASIAGMTGTLVCGSGMVCSSQTIDTVPPITLQPYSLPASYGAACDGVTNDAVALQAWLTGLSTTGQTGYIPPGAACFTNATLTVGPNPTTITGGGFNVSTIKGGAGAHPIFSATNISNLEISNIAIAGTDSVTSWAVSSVGALTISQNGSASQAGSNYTIRNVKFYGFNDNYWIQVVSSGTAFGMSKFKFSNIYVSSSVSDIPTDPTPNNNNNSWMTFFSGTAGNGRLSDITVDNLVIDGAGLCFGHIFFGNIRTFRIQNSQYNNVGSLNTGHCVNGFGTTNNSYPVAVYDLWGDGNPPNDGIVSNIQVINPHSAGVYLVGDGDPAHSAESYNNFNTLVTGVTISGQSSNSDASLPRGAVAITNATNITVNSSRFTNGYGGVSAAGQFSGTIDVSGNDCSTSSGSSVGNPTSCLRFQPGIGTSGGPTYIAKNNVMSVVGSTSRVVRSFADTGYHYNRLDFSDNIVTADNVGAGFAGVFISDGGSFVAKGNRFYGTAATSMFDASNMGNTVRLEAQNNIFDLVSSTTGVGLDVSGSFANLAGALFKNRTSGAAYAFQGVGTIGTLSGFQFANTAAANQAQPGSIGLTIPTWPDQPYAFVQNLAPSPSGSGIITTGWWNTALGVHWVASNTATSGGTFIPPEAYGVSCTGGNDTATLQAWLDAVVAAKAVALFPASYGGKTCNVTGLTLTAALNFSIESESMAGVTIAASVCNKSTLAILGQAYGATPNSGGAGLFTIRNVKFTACGTNGIALLINDAIYASLYNVETFGTTYLQGSEVDLVNHQSYSYNSDSAGLHIGGGNVFQSASVASGSAIATGLNTQILLVGMTITGAHVPGGTVISSCGAISVSGRFCDASGGIVMSQPATGTSATESLEFWTADITSSGPMSATGGNFQNQVGPIAPAIRIAGNSGAIHFNGCFLSAHGDSVASMVQIDGDPSGLAVGDVSFKNCHSESVNNLTNTIEQFLVGSRYKAGNVSIEGGSYYGHGDGINYTRDLVDVYAARSVTVQGVIATGLGSPGFSRSMIRLEAGYPATSDTYAFSNNHNLGSGVLYSDANGVLTGATGDASNQNARYGKGKQIEMSGATSGLATIGPQAVAGTPTLAWPTASGTLVSSGISPIAVNTTTGAASFAPAGTSLGVLYNNAATLGNTAAGTNGQLLLGVTSGAPQWGTLGGDATITNTGVLTLGSTVVSYAKITNLGALAVMGRSANSSGVGADIQATAASGGVLRESGSTIGFGTIATAGIADNAVTLAKLATQGANTALVNATSGTAIPTAFAMPTCSTAASALIWTVGTGYGCNTLGTMATQAASAVAVTGGTINGTTIGGSTPAAGTFTTLVGSTSVTSPLHYGGSSAGSTATVNGTSSGSPSNAYLLLQTNGQNVGIGNATPKTLLDLNTNLSSSPALIVSTSLARFQAPDGSAGGVEFISYGAAPSNILSGALAGGTSASPTVTPTGRSMFNLRGYGWNGSAWGVGGIINIRSNGVWSGSSQGTVIDFYTTNDSSTTVTLAGAFNQRGGLSVGSTNVDSGAGTLNLMKQTFASLVACSSTIDGTLAAITDSTTIVWGATITGSGANHVLGYCDGTNWTVTGK